MIILDLLHFSDKGIEKKLRWHVSVDYEMIMFIWSLHLDQNCIMVLKIYYRSIILFE
jgi:hypothetical protein